MRTIFGAILISLVAVSAPGRSIDASRSESRVSASTSPARCSAVHDAGKLVLQTTNGGIWGNRGGWAPFSLDLGGCNLISPTFAPTHYADEYPNGSFDHFLSFGSLWIGAITELNDTLVSTGLDGERVNVEFTADVYPQGAIIEQSLISAGSKFQARSDQDFVAVYTDTVIKGVPVYLEDEYLTRPTHQPLGIKVTQRSMQWSNALVDDFVITEFRIQNIGPRDLSKVYVGFCMIPAVGHSEAPPFYSDTIQIRIIGNDDICGFRNAIDFAYAGCVVTDTLDLAWSADNSGDPNLDQQWVETGENKSVRGVSGLRILEAPPETDVSFNWWHLVGYHPANQAHWMEKDYGPRRKPMSGQQPRDFGTGGVGDPWGDANKYYVMSNGEIDFDQVLIRTVAPSDATWEYPTDWAREGRVWAGSYVAYLLSVGPFELEREREQTVVVAYVAAPNFHTDPTNINRLIDEDYDGWYAHMNFGTLAKHAKMAEWVYDNPGYDTDGDGYAGKSRICVLDSALIDGHWVPSIAETTFCAGDGVADWRAPGAPPAPKFWLSPYGHGIRIRFNGSKSETTKDLVSNRIDFEGYRIYLSRDEREASLVTAASYDYHNYDKYVWNPQKYPLGGYEVQEIPMTLSQLRCLYAFSSEPCTDSLFDPLAFTADTPFRMPGFTSDSVFYFRQHGYNASRLGSDTPIRRIYPDEPKPVPGQPIPPEAYTEDGYLKYYEYECVIENLLPTVPYYVNVTAFDYGDPAGGVEALESSKMLGMQDCFALENANQTGAQDKPAYVYPNPYRTDANYRQQGYEGRGSDRINDRERRIHFANLPARCWIRVHTLDGDLVREIRHDMDPSDPASDHDTWDLINRNIMAVESGLYYWSVEGDDGKVQIGKLVIIK